MKKPLLIGLIGLLAVGAANAHGSTEPLDEKPSSSADLNLGPAGPRTAASNALVQKFSNCAAKEGTVVGAQEQKLLDSAAPGLASALTQDHGACAGQTPETCASRVLSWSCEELAKQLMPSDMPGLPDSNEPAPMWAVTYAGAITGKVQECYVAETGASPDAAARQQLDSMQQLLAKMLGQVTRVSTCSVDEQKLGPCTAALRQLPCDSLAQQLESAESMLANALMTACAGLLQCGGPDEFTNAK